MTCLKCSTCVLILAADPAAFDGDNVIGHGRAGSRRLWSLGNPLGLSHAPELALMTTQASWMIVLTINTLGDLALDRATTA